MGVPKALLVVEDEPLVRSMIEEVLLDKGYVVYPAENASLAIELISKIGCTIDAVVTDIRLGAGPDGWMLARYLREQCPGLPVIYVTGDSAHEWRAEGVPESTLIQKPFVMAQITDAVAHLVN